MSESFRTGSFSGLLPAGEPKPGMFPENTDGAEITLELRDFPHELRLLTPSKEPKPEMTAQNLDGTKPAFGLEVYTHEMRSEAA